MAETSILLIYTGGTIGMIKDEETGMLRPFNLDNLVQYIPEIARFGFRIDTYSFDSPVDSSNMTPELWVELASLIEKNYQDYDGFVILHGSDTMAYTASALSFMLENLSKPVILTGSQLPASVLRTDASENLLTSIEIAASKKLGKPIVPEVCIYFEYELFRGNRTYKYNAENFDAFRSANLPPLAEAGVQIKYNEDIILKPIESDLKVHKKLDTNVMALRLFPGISLDTVEYVLNKPGLKALVLETFGSGNAPTNPDFIKLLNLAIKNRLIVYNVTQCREGKVEQGQYETSQQLQNIGLISGREITVEAALTKLMFLLAQNKPADTIKTDLQRSLRGEIDEGNYFL